MTTLPSTMTAIEIALPGGPDVLLPARRPVPEPGLGEVLIAVEAAGINRPDVMQREGRYAPPKGASDIPGLEVAGTVVKVGMGAHGLVPGDKVCALVTGGGYAEYVAAPAAQCLPIPKGLSAVEAASLPETFFTVWTNLVQRGRLAAGEVVLIQGGSSGIGAAAIQIAKTRGARVFATVGSNEKANFCERLGAELAINYKTEDFVDLVRKATDGHGADLILDMVGGDYLNRHISLAAVEGRIVQIAVLRGAKVEIDLGQIMGKRLTLTGSTLRPRPVADKALIAEALKHEVWPLLEKGTIKPVVYKTFPLAEAAEAHRLMEASTHCGKIVLTLL
jgi:NADPH2:quinone reductase